jgi:predicted nucleic acid-binding protein
VPGKARVTELQVLIDSDAFVGRFFTQDAHFQRANALFDRLERDQTSLVTTSAVIGETATVLSHRQGQALAVQFLNIIEHSRLPVIYIDETLYQQGIALFKVQTHKGTSITDCLNVVVMRQYQIENILSFDQGYTHRFGVPLLELSSDA